MAEHMYQTGSPAEVARAQEVSTLVCLEYFWHSCGRPFYNVWPALVPHWLEKINFEKLRLTELAPVCPCLEFRFAVGREPTEFDFSSRAGTREPYKFIGFRVMACNGQILADKLHEALGFKQYALRKHGGPRLTLAAIQKWGPGKYTPFATFFDMRDQLADIVDRTTFFKNDPNDVTIAQLFGPQGVGEINDYVLRCYVMSVKLWAVACLLHEDDTIIDRLIMKKDEKKRCPSRMDELYARAEARGLHGFHMGRILDVSPHYRVPHFAIRWMGRGTNVVKKPTLRPVKGSVVHRRRAVEVPTGYAAETT